MVSRLKLIFPTLLFIMASPALADDWNSCINEEAIGACSVIIDAHTETKDKIATAYFKRGNAYSNQGDVGQAIENYDKAIGLNPKFGMAYFNRAGEYESKSDWKRAAADWQAAGANMSEGDSFLDSAKTHLSNAAAKLDTEETELVKRKAKLTKIKSLLLRQKHEFPDAKPLKTEFTTDETGAHLVFYDPACDNSSECEVAVISCASSRNFDVYLYGLAQNDIADWFATSDGTVTLVEDASMFDFQASQIDFSELNGDWGVQVFENSQPEKIWATLSKAKDVSITAGKHIVVLPLTADMNKLVKVCTQKIR